MKTVVTAALIGLVVISSGIRAHAQSAAEQELIKLEH
jgi:hypothetical protein